MSDPKHRVEVYPVRYTRLIGTGMWRWRKCSRANGQIVGTSHEAFASKRNAIRAALAANPEVATVTEVQR